MMSREKRTQPKGQKREKAKRREKKRGKRGASQAARQTEILSGSNFLKRVRQRRGPV